MNTYVQHYDEEIQCEEKRRDWIEVQLGTKIIEIKLNNNSKYTLLIHKYIQVELTGTCTAWIYLWIYLY